jgi:glyoxylase-like metal-dependent hydrolase (beta-lactamase superfamily II)
MEPFITGLYASDPEPLPFAPSEHVRAFLLRREQGNLLVYSAPAVAADAAAVAALGGVARIYLNHGHEAAFGAGERVRTALGVPLVAHADDAASAGESAEVGETFDGRGRVGDDFEVIPIPGHTPGATAFLWHGERRVLFTGDSLYLDGDGEWVAAVLDSSDRDAYVDSLELIRGLDFDVLVPWVASTGGPFYAETDRADARRRIDAILARLRRGEAR